MFCQKCGAKNDDDARFCTTCGSPLAPAKDSSQESPKDASQADWTPKQSGPMSATTINADRGKATSHEQDSNQDFSASLIAFWVKGHMGVDDHFLTIEMQNTVFFGLIPAGRRKSRSPLENVSNVYLSKSYKFGAMIIGVLIALGGLSTVSSRGGFFGGVVLLAIGVLMFLGGIQTTFAYELNGTTHFVNLPFFEQQKASDFCDQVNAAIAKNQDSRNVGYQFQQFRQQ